jgi:hypothetical protein
MLQYECCTDCVNILAFVNISKTQTCNHYFIDTHHQLMVAHVYCTRVLLLDEYSKKGGHFVSVEELSLRLADVSLNH